MNTKTYHVVPNSKGGRDNSLKHFDEKNDAIALGRNVCKNQDAELVIHKKDGRIQNKNSYGNDSCPPKAKK